MVAKQANPLFDGTITYAIFFLYNNVLGQYNKCIGWANVFVSALFTTRN
jgi:hypothetical protein